jgi:CheY-like chemotaxis protein
VTILIVDDESGSRTLLTAVLTEQGYTVRAADGGELGSGDYRRHMPGSNSAGYPNDRDERV